MERLVIGILLAIFGGIVLHAPISVFFGTLLPDYELVIKTWKEILMGVALLLLGVMAWRTGKLKQLLQDKLLWLIGGYALLHLLLLGVFWQGFESGIAGMLIDLRYVLYFTLVYIALTLHGEYKPLFVKVGVVGAVIVVAFGFLQATVLPADILKHIGYSQTTIVPYLTVDQNPDYVRINSTLRGPNPLGAYAAIVLAMVVATAAVGWKTIRKQRNLQVLLVVLSVGAAVTLWASYSRSALAAVVLMIAVVVAVGLRRKIKRPVWITGVVIICALVGGLVAVRDSHFVSNVILHENPTGGSITKSNDGHVESLNDGWARMVRQPLGAGVGSTGSASLATDQPVIIENQYLFIAHETGWVGLGMFTALFGWIMVLLWRRRRDWLALGALASGIGLAVIGILQPVWVDDTVSIVWWGIAAIALGGSYGKKRTRK